MRRSKVIVGVCGDVVPRSPCWDLHKPRKARPGVHASRERLTFRRPSNAVLLLRSGRRYASVAAYCSAPNVERTSSNVNVAERRDCPCACFLRASPSNDGDHRATAALSVATGAAARLQNSSGVAGLHPSHTPRSPPRAVLLREAFAPRVCPRALSSPPDVA